MTSDRAVESIVDDPTVAAIHEATCREGRIVANAAIGDETHFAVIAATYPTSQDAGRAVVDCIPGSVIDAVTEFAAADGGRGRLFRSSS